MLLVNIEKMCLIMLRFPVFPLYMIITATMANVLRFQPFSLSILKNVDYQGWNSQKACQNSKQARP